MLFTGFSKCLYPIQKFQSDSERPLAVIFETDPVVVKWLKPEKGQFQIFYRNDREYIPDFAVETEMLSSSANRSAPTRWTIRSPRTRIAPQ